MNITEDQRPKVGPRIKGLVADAKKLGVSRSHLSYVLHGRRQSAPILERYRQLQVKKVSKR